MIRCATVHRTIVIPIGKALDKILFDYLKAKKKKNQKQIHTLLHLQCGIGCIKLKYVG